MSEPRMRDVFDNISPVDYRNWDPEVARFLSENGFTGYKLRMELALVRVLCRRGLCTQEVVDEVEAACRRVTTAEVYDEEAVNHHDIMALVKCIRDKVSDAAKRFVHMTATSYDIVDSANAARFKDVVEQVLIPTLIELERELIDMTLRESDTVQVGRTHGQHAVPITFGFGIAGFVSRLGGCIIALRELAAKLRGKFSGAAGTNSATSLFFDDPMAFEAEVLAEVGLAPVEHATQIVPPEAMMRLLFEVVNVATVLGNIGDNGRNLQRTEIGEVGEPFEEEQVGSTAMPQKQNPIKLENTKSMWKIVAPRLLTVVMDGISDHERDLTNSASARTYGEIIAYVVYMAKTVTKVMRKLTVNRGNMKRNLNMSKGAIAAEPLQLILSSLGLPDAHKKVKLLTQIAKRDGLSLESVVLVSTEMQPYLKRMTEHQRVILSDPFQYIGIAPQKARDVANRWKQQLGL